MASVLRKDIEKKQQIPAAGAGTAAAAAASAGGSTYKAGANPVSVKTVSGGGSLLGGGSYPKSSAGYSGAPKRSDYDTASAIKEMYDKTVAEGYKDTYSGNYKQLVDDTIAQLNSRQFDYDVNADGFYKNYLETAKRQGQMAAKDSAAKSASLSGGYANSWGQDAAQQIYNMYMQDANDAAVDFADRAYSRYQDAGTELLNMLGVYQSLDETDYARARDVKNDYDSLVSQLWSRYIDAVGVDSDRYSADYNAFSDAVTTALSAGDFDKLDSLGIDTATLRAQHSAQMAAYGSGGSGSKGSGSKGSSDDDDGSGAELYTFRGIDYNNSYTDDKGGGYTFMKFTGPDGKVISVEKGINPYTGTKNPDIKNGTFNNGYQPDNIGGVKLIESGYQDNIYGRTQNIYLLPVENENADKRIIKNKESVEDKLPVYKAYMWNGSANSYKPFTVDGIKQATKEDLDKFYK